MTPISPQSHYIVRDAVKLHHLDWGNHGRHPLVLVHGSRLHAHVWNHFSRRFSDRYHVIALDQRGHGDSGWDAQRRYQMEDFYEDLRAVVEARRLSRFTLIGHSLGGRVSMLFASRHPELLERLVLVDITPGRPAVVAGSVDPDDARTAPGEFDAPQAALVHLKRLMPRAPAPLVEESVRHGLRETGSGRYTWKYDPAFLGSARSRSNTVDLWSAVKSIPTPTQLQYGSLSNVVNPELAARLAETMPRCAVERIEGAGHGLFTDQPEAFAESVERFLAATPVSARVA
jgi:pimeloyl-ACP methyl ester carboxylesterase